MVRVIGISGFRAKKCAISAAEFREENSRGGEQKNPKKRENGYVDLNCLLSACL